MPPKVRRRIPGQKGLYQHSTPPKVVPNGKAAADRRTRKLQNQTNNNEGITVKPSNIRIWIHDKDIAKLTRVLWSGQGFRLLNETSTYARVRKFLENVPFVLNAIKEIHEAVIHNNIDQLQFLLDLPPPAIITTRDQNGLTVAHKAAGLGYPEMLDFVIQTWPQASHEVDKTGKTPLHWSALAKDGQVISDMLMQNFNVREDVMDYRMKTPAYYKTKPQELEKSFLTTSPPAPRIMRHQQVDWNVLEDDIGDLNGARPTGKIVVEKKKKAEVERQDSDMDPDLEERAKRIKKSLDQQLSAKLENATPLSKIFHNDVIPNGNGGNMMINSDELQRKLNELIATPMRPKTPFRLVNETSMEQIEHIDAPPDIHEVATPQMGQSPEPLVDTPDINPSTINEQQNSTSAATETIIADPVTEISTTNITDQNSDPQIEPIEPIEPNEIQDDPKESDNDIAIVIEDAATNSDENNDDNIVDESNEGEESRNIEVEEANEDNERVKRENIKNKPTETDDDNADIKEKDVAIENNGENIAEPIEMQKNDIEEKTVEAIDESNIRDIDLLKTEDAKEPERAEETTETKDSEKAEDTTKTKDTEVNESSQAENVENTQDTKETEDIAEKNEPKDAGVLLTSEIHQSEEIVQEEEDKTITDENEKREDETRHTEEERDEADAISPNETIVGEEENKEEYIIEVSEQSTLIEKIEGKQEESDDEVSHHDSMDNLDYEDSADTSFRSPSSPSTSHDIEGFVHGEADDNQVQSQSAEIIASTEAQVAEIVKSGDMEKLASIVLNGEGNKLLGSTSTQPEIQAFLENVPSYMDKIKRVHQSARDGNLKELQTALDRRKFAIARNDISPKGATPLHVSTLFGHSGIVRYLAGRFPETTSTVDEDGRTPLHYAATMNDNSHFYNLLIHFGSNPKATDKLGNTPEFYKDHKIAGHILSHKQLLKNFGANEALETEMFSDQVPDDVHSARKYLDDEDVITTLERCFKLINNPSSSANNNINNGSASSLRLTITNYLARFMKRSVFDKIKYRQTKLDHNLFDVIWPAMKKSSNEKPIDEDLNSGVVAPDYDVFVVFQEFFIPLIKDMHCMNLSQELKPHPRIFYFPLIDGEKNEFINYDIDDNNKYVSEAYVECARNLDEFELPLNLNIGQIEHAERVLIEKILTTDFAKAIGEPEAGIYYTMNEVLESQSEIRNVLENSKLMIPLLDSRDPELEAECHAINGMFWPYGRGVFISHQGDLAAWINVQDHLRIIVGTPNRQPTNIGYAYSKVGRAIMFLEERLHFRESYFLGYLSSRPSFLGTSLKISTVLELPNLMKEIDNLRHLCVVRGLYMIPGKANDNKCRVLNMQSLGCTEWRLFQDYCTAVSNILQLEKDMSLTNSKQIAAMLVKIFRRKKTSVTNNND